MNIIKIHKDYGTQAKCLKYLQKLRWHGNVTCTYCGSDSTKPIKTEAGRHSCRNCKRSFSVLVDTIFEDTRLPLPQWFMIIGLVLNAKQGMSAKQIQRNVGVTYKTAYYTAMRIRIGMLMPETELNGIIEMDESYFGGKARKRNHPKNEATLSTVTTKRGRGTKKVSVAGMVERGGDVKTKVIEKLTKRNLLFMLKNYAKEDDSILITDGFSSYKHFDKYIEHLTINHSKSFSKGIVHVNSIEGFWSYVKNGIRGNYKSISPKYLPFYLIEYEWKYNHRNYRGNEFELFLKNALQREKELEYWKAENPKQVKKVAYGQ
jgi:transposase-like protein